MPANPASDAIRLTIRGLGPVVSFKNSKILVSKSPKGIPLKRPFLVTKGEYKKQMASIIESFVSQLYCEYRTRRAAMRTALSQPLWIVLSLPADDSLNQIPEIHLWVEMVEKGQEGADVLLEPLT